MTQKDSIPLFHLSYQGNLHDSKVFHQVIGNMKRRMVALNFDLERRTLVFERGNHSKKNLAVLAKLKLHYLGGLVPYQHQQRGDRARLAVLSRLPSSFRLAVSASAKSCS